MLSFFSRKKQDPALSREPVYLMADLGETPSDDASFGVLESPAHAVFEKSESGKKNNLGVLQTY